MASPGRPRNALFTARQIKLWCKWFYEKEGRWPTIHDQTVWEKAANGRWRRSAAATWWSINYACRTDGRLLALGGSLAKLKRQQGFTALPAERELVRLIKLYFEKEGRWPTCEDHTVWDRAAGGRWTKLPWTWFGVNARLGQGSSLASGATTLAGLKRMHGLHGDLSVNLLKTWLRWFSEKEGRLPRLSERVWLKGEDGSWRRGEGWEALNQACRLGLRGLTPGRGVLGLSSPSSSRTTIR
jgi:hypothetical protein